ncbi:hypothetical protein Gorai_015159, partial [Gossypium raimondii]|nr:hypothetical protein [Gossypium raimondii]
WRVEKREKRGVSKQGKLTAEYELRVAEKAKRILYSSFGGYLWEGGSPCSIMPHHRQYKWWLACVIGQVVDKLVGLPSNTIGKDLDTKEDFDVLEGDIQKSIINGIPSIHFSDSIQQILIRDLDNNMILKLLGRSIGYSILQNKIYNLWKPSSSFFLMDIEHGYFLAKFKSVGPWIIFGQYLTIQPWSVSFDPAQTFPSVVMSWIRFLGLPGYIYKRKILVEMGGMVSKIVKLDMNIDNIAKGRFARMVVYVNLDRYGHMKDVGPFRLFVPCSKKNLTSFELLLEGGNMTGDGTESGSTFSNDGNNEFFKSCSRSKVTSEGVVDVTEAEMNNYLDPCKHTMINFKEFKDPSSGISMEGAPLRFLGGRGGIFVRLDRDLANGTQASYFLLYGELLDPMRGLLSNIFLRIKFQDIAFSEKLISNEEIKKALFDMAPLKAPSSDGFHAHFFQSQWDIVSNAICEWVQEIFASNNI